jgi:hypothetical protein
MQVEQREENAKPKWRKVGICRISTRKNVLLLAIFELDRTRWQIVDVGDLLELIAGHRPDVSIMERNLNV